MVWIEGGGQFGFMASKLNVRLCWFACQCMREETPPSHFRLLLPPYCLRSSPSVFFCQYEDDAVRQLLVAAGIGSQQGGANVSAWIGLSIGTTTGAAIPGNWTDGERLEDKRVQ